jgi:hypothetical protein
MVDVMAKDFDTWDGSKQAAGGTIREKCVFGEFDAIDGQFWKCANTFDPDCMCASADHLVNSENRQSD